MSFLPLDLFFLLEISILMLPMKKKTKEAFRDRSISLICLARAFELKAAVVGDPDTICRPTVVTERPTSPFAG